MIVGVAGHAGAGKDSVGNALQVMGFQRLAFADVLKDMAEDVYPWLKYVNRFLGRDRAKRLFPPARRVLQRLGTAGRTHISTNVWVDAVFQQMDADKNYVITDVRYANESEAIHHHGGTVILVQRPGWGPANHHPSEMLAGVTPDIVIANDGTLGDLRQRVFYHGRRLLTQHQK